MKLTTHQLVSLMAAAAWLALTPTLSAQEKAPKPEDNPKRESRPANVPREEAIKGRVDKMAEDLKLNDEQKQKVEALLKEQAGKRTDMRDATPEERKAFREEFNKKMKGVLTAEQFEKWEKMRPAGGPRPGGQGDAPKQPATDKKPQAN